MRKFLVTDVSLCFSLHFIAFSGQKQENPLLLLGQYSDDELDEETSKRPKLDKDGSSPDALDEEVIFLTIFWLIGLPSY